jgi:hypothetical protein
MSFIQFILDGKLEEAKEYIHNRLNQIVSENLEEQKKYVAEEQYEYFDEAVSRNIIRQGRIQKIRRRIRRNAKGRIIVQRNVRRSAVKGYRISGNSVKRISAMQRINKTRKLKRYWKTKGKATMSRRRLKYTMSLKRRKSMGIR